MIESIVTCVLFLGVVLVYANIIAQFKSLLHARDEINAPDDEFLSSIRELQRVWEMERRVRVARLSRHMAWLPEERKVNWKKEGF